MARHGVVLLVSALALSACNKASEDSTNYEVALHAPAMAPRPGAPGPMQRSANPAEAASDAAASAGPSAPRPPVVTAPMLAYRYDYAIEAPPKAIRVLVARHEAACQAAGPTVCQVTSAKVSEAGPDRISGALSLRATPAWLKTFRGGLSREAETAGGRLVRASTDTEDLSRAIVDTEAALRARTTLRDRLQSLLASRPGKLSELLEVERELARVQGEIDATQSELAMMRTRVATSTLDIAYESAGVLAPQGAASPIGQALGEVTGVLALTIATMIRLVTWLAPWALLIGGLLWLFRKRIFRKKPRPAPAPAPTPEAQPPA